VWQASVAAHLFPPELGPQPAQRIANPDFAAPLDRGLLDWQTCVSCGPWVAAEHDPAVLSAIPGDSAHPRRSALSLVFHGDQGDAAVLVHQQLLLRPARAYRLRFASAAANGDAKSGGVFVAVRSGNRDLVRVPAAMASGWKLQEQSLTTPADTADVAIEVRYARPLGTVPLAATVWLSGFALTPLPQ